MYTCPKKKGKGTASSPAAFDAKRKSVGQCSVISGCFPSQYFVPSCRRLDLFVGQCLRIISAGKSTCRRDSAPSPSVQCCTSGSEDRRLKRERGGQLTKHTCLQTRHGPPADKRRPCWKYTEIVIFELATRGPFVFHNRPAAKLKAGSLASAMSRIPRFISDQS